MKKKKKKKREREREREEERRKLNCKTTFGRPVSSKP